MAKRRNRYLYNFTADTYIHSGAGVYEQMAQSLSERLGEVLPPSLLGGPSPQQMSEMC